MENKFQKKELSPANALKMLHQYIDKNFKMWAINLLKLPLRYITGMRKKETLKEQVRLRRKKI